MAACILEVCYARGVASVTHTESGTMKNVTILTESFPKKAVEAVLSLVQGVNSFGHCQSESVC